VPVRLLLSDQVAHGYGGKAGQFEMHGCWSRNRAVKVRSRIQPLIRGAKMLRDSPLDVVLLATDLDAAKAFYAEKLGLPLLDGSEQSLTFSCGGGSRVLITKSTTGTADSQTQAQWRVQDLAAELADLRSRGVEIAEYDDPGFKTENGIYDAGFALFAWITDPAKNSLALLQYK
jgi:predicted enzyme related to lactoylglutathione lyase